MKLNTVFTLYLAFLVLSWPIRLQASISEPINDLFQLSARSPVDEVFESVTSDNNIQDVTIDWQSQMPGGDLIFFDSDGKPATLTSNGFGNPCVNGIRNAEELNGRVYFATSTWCNLSEKAGMEFYEFKPELISQ